MDAKDLLGRISDNVSIRRVFGEPVERDGVLVIPVAVVAGGGGGGAGPGDEGSGAGFGIWARPLGVYVVDGGQVRFRPAIDAVGLAVVVLAALRLLRRRGAR
jgi:uncharacterized spore protein YtfJ